MRLLLNLFLIVLLSSSALCEEFNRAKHFGKGWDDLDRNGLDTREEILKSSEIYLDPYSGTILRESDIDIDHIVSLEDAWNKGASEWTQEQRIQFKNDKSNLTISLKNINRAKGSKSFEEWIPPNQFNAVWFLVKVESTCRKYSLFCDYTKLEELQVKYQKRRKGGPP